MMLNSSENYSYIEKQRFTQKWILGLVIAIALVAWIMFYRQIIQGTPVGNNPAPDSLLWAIWILVGLALPLLIFMFRMTTRIWPNHIEIKMTILGRRLMALAEIKECSVRQYRPIREYGGWGIRWSPSRGMAYSVSGNKGVQLELKNGKKILIGSQEPENLAGAIAEARRKLTV